MSNIMPVLRNGNCHSTMAKMRDEIDVFSTIHVPSTRPSFRRTQNGDPFTSQYYQAQNQDSNTTIVPQGRSNDAVVQRI